MRVDGPSYRRQPKYQKEQEERVGICRLLSIRKQRAKISFSGVVFSKAIIVGLKECRFHGKEEVGGTEVIRELYKRKKDYILPKSIVQAKSRVKIGFLRSRTDKGSLL